MLPKHSVNSIFKENALRIIQKKKLPYDHLKVINSLTKCRTSALGAHWEACDSCGIIKVHYNSCGNRHCPSCQGVNRERWILQRSYDLFDVKHFHVTFTVPSELRLLFKFNKRLLYNLLLNCVKETLLSFGKDKRSRLEAKLGVIAILHTWTQQLKFHPHVHCIVPAGGLSDQGKWKSVKRKKFLFSVQALSNVFSAKFCEQLRTLHHQLKLPKQLSKLKCEGEFYDFTTFLKRKKWVVNCKPSFNGAKQVLEYLGRYSHKIAISNHRIIQITKTHVTFSYRDRTDGDKKKTMSLETDEFINRFLEHVLPHRFVKIRHFGYFSTRTKASSIQLIRTSLKQKTIPKPEKFSLSEVMLITKGIDLKKCPCCKTGNKIVFKVLQPIRGSPRKLPLGKTFE